MHECLPLWRPRSSKFGDQMVRLLRHVVIALVIFGAGAVVGHLNARETVFRLAVDAPAGETTIGCDGCAFLSWTNGRSDEPSRSITVSCPDTRCSQAVGGITLGGSETLLVARSAVSSERR